MPTVTVAWDNTWSRKKRLKEKEKERGGGGRGGNRGKQE